MSEVSTKYFLGNTEIIQSFVGDVPVLINPFKVFPYPTQDLLFYLSGEDYNGSGNWFSVNGSKPITGSFFGAPTYNSSVGTFSFTEVDGMICEPFNVINMSGEFYDGKKTVGTVFLVGRFTGSINAKHGRMLVGQTHGAPNTSLTRNWFLGTYSSSQAFNEVYHNPGDGFVYGPTGSYDTNWRVYTATFDEDTNTSKYYLNGIFVTSSFVTGLNSPLGFAGLGVNTGSFMNGTGGGGENSNSEIAEIMVYNAVLSDDNISEIASYLGQRFGITPQKTIVTNGLKHYFNANQNATTSSWADTITTASANFQTGVTAGTLRYNQSLPSASYYDFVSSSTSNEMFFGRAPLIPSQSSTVLMMIKPQKDTDLQILNAMGVSGGPLVSLASLLIVSGNLGYDNGEIEFGGSPKTGSLDKLTLNQWQQVGYTFVSESSTITLYVNNTSSSFTDTFDWLDFAGIYWLIGEERGKNLYSGSVATQLIYDRALSPNEVANNYEYFNQFYN
jgi:hypothetical protein